MRKLVCILVMLIALPAIADDKASAVELAKAVVADAYSVHPQFVSVYVNHTANNAVRVRNKTPLLSWKRRGAIWVSPYTITWDENNIPVWKVGMGTSYALGTHSSLVLRVQRDNSNKRTRPELGWTFNF